MAGGRMFRQEFDRNRDFVVRRSFKANGRQLPDGHPLDKSEFTVRRLRQLFDMRAIDYPPDLEAGPPPGALPEAYDRPAVEMTLASLPKPVIRVGGVQRKRFKIEEDA